MKTKKRPGLWGNINRKKNGKQLKKQSNFTSKADKFWINNLS